MTMALVAVALTSVTIAQKQNQRTQDRKALVEMERVQSTTLQSSNITILGR